MSESSAKPPGVSFVHLRTHTAYSLSEGALQIKELAELAKDAGMPAVAITDTGNLFGALEFSEAMAEKGIQPIIGCTLKVDMPSAEGGRPQAHRRDFAACRRSHLLAKDETGLPQPDEAVEPGLSLDARQCRASRHLGLSRAAFSEGLICLTGGPHGPVNDALVAGQGALATEHAERLKDMFGDRLYIELQRHGTARRARRRSGASSSLPTRSTCPLVATNEPISPRPTDYAAHDALICIAEGEVHRPPRTAAA